MLETKKTFKLKVFSPFEIYFDGEAYSLSADNDVGRFDILRDHTNFITLVTKGDVRITSPYGVRKFELSRGILKVHNNYVILFANI